ncbi:MAG: hypothetical protein ACRDO8_10125 [Nocardioidaceae bacterium]
MAHPMYETHRDTLTRAVEAIRDRGFWSPYPEMPSGKIYGQDAAETGERAFEAYRGARFPLDQAGTDDWVGAERSPFGVEMDIRYPHPDVDRLLAVARRGTGHPRRRLPGDPAPVERPQLRDGTRGHAHHRPGVHDGVPGWRA